MNPSDLGPRRVAQSSFFKKTEKALKKNKIHEQLEKSHSPGPGG